MVFFYDVVSVQFFLSKSVNENSTEAGQGHGSYTDYKQLYMSTIRVKSCLAWLMRVLAPVSEHP